MENPTPKIDWDHSLELIANLDGATRRLYANKIHESEKFVPLEASNFVPEEILEIEKAVKELEAEVKSGIKFNNYFIKLLRKIQSLIAEMNPDYFGTLPLELKKHILYAKIDFPTEREVKDGIFDFLNGKKSSGNSLSPFSFDRKVQDVMKYNDLSERIRKLFIEYERFFRKNN